MQSKEVWKEQEVKSSDEYMGISESEVLKFVERGIDCLGAKSNLWRGVWEGVFGPFHDEFVVMVM